MRILLAEDNPICTCLTVELLRKQGHSVSAVTSGTAALSAVQKEPFDLVLMDLHMPLMDGFSATRAIRADEAGTGRHLLIVAITAHTNEANRVACLAAGMDEYLAKPLRTSEFLKVIQKLGLPAFQQPAPQADRQIQNL